MHIDIKRASRVDAEFIAPPSKSCTHRAVIVAALADGRSVISNPLISDDTLITIAGLNKLGVHAEVVSAPDSSSKSEGASIIVDGCGGNLPKLSESVTLDCGNSGTSLRHLVTLALLSPMTVTIGGSSRMEERPIGALSDALTTAGAKITYHRGVGFPPLSISGEFNGGVIPIDASKSSQFISSVLLCAPYAKEAVSVVLLGEAVSKPYVSLSIAVMREFGAEVAELPPSVSGDNLDARWSFGGWGVKRGTYHARDYIVEGDYSSASYFFAIAAVCGGRVGVCGLNLNSAQGDKVFLEILEKMGCRVTYSYDKIIVERDTIVKLCGVKVNLSDSPDIVQTVSAVAVFADSPTTIEGIAHLRYKESDRIKALRIMTESCGCKFLEEGESITIIPPKAQKGVIGVNVLHGLHEDGLHGFVCEPENDHRTAMSCAIIGLGCGNTRINGAECVSKSFPEFWTKLKGAGLLE